jgi:hypothetical protein
MTNTWFTIVPMRQEDEIFLTGVAVLSCRGAAGRNQCELDRHLRHRRRPWYLNRLEVGSCRLLEQRDFNALP